MASHYHAVLERLRQSFPQPVSDPVHDAYFVYSIAQALSQLDNLKSELPILGGSHGGDPFRLEEGHAARMPERPVPLKDVIDQLVGYFEGMTIWGHPRSQVNVVSWSSIAAIVGALLPTIYNPNLVWDGNSHRAALAEVEATSIMAGLIGYDPARAGGVFTFGGTGTELYGVRIGLSKALPGSMAEGVREDAVVFASSQSHYARVNVSSWLGLGSKNVLVVPAGLDNAVRLDLLEAAARRELERGRRIACFIATLGTTDAFGLDDLGGIVQLRDRLVEEHRLDYRPQVHADAVIGWAWSVFNGYDFEANPMGFRPRTVRALAGAHRRVGALALADSVGVDFHKMGFVPYVSSLFLCRERADLDLLARDPADMPYLYQFGTYKPGTYTLETSRSASGPLAAVANLRLLGKEGYRAVLGHLVEMAEVLREHLEGHSATTVLNGENFGTVTLFRAYPDGVDTWSIVERERTDPGCRDLLRRHNEYNRAIFRYVQDEAMKGRSVMISLTENYRRTEYGEPMVALKSFITSPFADEANVELVVRKVLEAREHVEA